MKLLDRMDLLLNEEETSEGRIDLEYLNCDENEIQYDENEMQHDESYQRDCYKEDQIDHRNQHNVVSHYQSPQKYVLQVESRHSYHQNNNPYIRSVLNKQPQMYNQQRQNAHKLSSQIPKSVLPQKFQSVFNFQYFNRMQSEAFTNIYHSDYNYIVSAPTGSGKTVLFELAIIKLLTYNALNSSANSSLRCSKILYMAPTRALCIERHQDWTKKFANLGISVGLLTGDTSSLEVESVKRSDIIICTPEKWDVISRRWFDYSRLLELVRLFLIDEIHILKEKRGTILEVVVTRMKKMCLNLRIIAVSATIPNIEDVTAWLETKVMSFDESYRAVQLIKVVYGYRTSGSSANHYQFDSFLNTKLVDVLQSHSNNKPVLIFCPTRAQCISTAKYLESKAQYIFNFDNSALENDTPLISSSKDLTALIAKKIAYHHAGLSFDDRKLIETSFKSGRIRIICSTTTLAVGVNLPAYCVIIKGTKAWTSNGSFDEYSEIDILQMLGRAGRPQYETEGCVVIMTDSENKSKYEKIVKGTEKLESSLNLHLAEHITSEILLGTITNIETALKWIKSTFLYQRYLKNPTAYSNINKNVLSSNNLSLEERLLQFCELEINKLISENLVYLEESTKKFKCTAYGNSMCVHYIYLETIKLFINKESKHKSVHDILNLLSSADEFNEIRLKYNERKLFKELNQSPLLKFPFNNSSKKIEKNCEKVSLIIQYELDGLTFPNYQGSFKLHQAFQSDKAYVFKQSPRILKAAIEIFIQNKDSKSLLSTLQLYRCISGKCWESSPMVLRQLNDIGLAYVRKFANVNIFSFGDLINLSRDKIEYYLGLKPGGGTKFVNTIKTIPLVSFKLQYLNHKLCTQKKPGLNYLEVTVSVEIGLLNPNEAKYIWNGMLCHINVTSEISGTLVDFRRMPLKKIKDFANRFEINFKLYSINDSLQIFLNFEEIAGLGITKKWNLHEDLPKSVSNVKMILSSLRSTEAEPEHMKNFDESLSDFSFSESDPEQSQKSLSFKYKRPIEESLASGSKRPANSVSISQDPTSPDNTFTKAHSSKLANGNYRCLHLCKDRARCRHLCCKEGIPKKPTRSDINCSHTCKEKLKCRHLCCRESIERFSVGEYTATSTQSKQSTILNSGPISKATSTKNDKSSQHIPATFVCSDFSSSQNGCEDEFEKKINQMFDSLDKYNNIEENYTKPVLETNDPKMRQNKDQITGMYKVNSSSTSQAPTKSFEQMPSNHSTSPTTLSFRMESPENSHKPDLISSKSLEQKTSNPVKRVEKKRKKRTFRSTKTLKEFSKTYNRFDSDTDDDFWGTNTEEDEVSKNRRVTPFVDFEKHLTEKKSIQKKLEDLNTTSKQEDSSFGKEVEIDQSTEATASSLFTALVAHKQIAESNGVQKKSLPAFTANSQADEAPPSNPPTVCSLERSINNIALFLGSDIEII